LGLLQNKALTAIFWFDAKYCVMFCAFVPLPEANRIIFFNVLKC